MKQGVNVERAKEAGLINHGLGRYEVFDHPEGQLGNLKGFLKDKGLPFGIHAPLYRPVYFPFKPVSCFFLSDDAYKRELSFSLLEETARHARDWGAEYIVSHFAFVEDTQDEDKAWKLASQSASRLSEIAQSYGRPIFIEYSGYSNAFHEPEKYVEVLAPYPNLGLCIDIGHASICSKLRRSDYLKDIETLAPFARSMHLWNTKNYDHWKQQSHVPLHPSQSPEEGWIDIERTLEITLGYNRDIKIIFEYSFIEMSDGIKDGFDWIENIVRRLKGSKV